MWTAWESFYSNKVQIYISKGFLKPPPPVKGWDTSVT